MLSYCQGVNKNYFLDGKIFLLTKMIKLIMVKKIKIKKRKHRDQAIVDEQNVRRDMAVAREAKESSRLADAVRAKVSPELLITKALQLLDHPDPAHVKFALMWLAERGWGRAPINLGEIVDSGPRAISLAQIVEATLSSGEAPSAESVRSGSIGEHIGELGKIQYRGD
jgi:hypothetical protein